MINLQRIATGDISGLDSAELDFMSKLSKCAEATIDQWSGLPILDLNEVETFLTDLRDPEVSYRDLDVQELEGIKRLEQSSKSPSTVATTKNHVDRFKKFLREKNLPDDIESMPLRYLDGYLRLWYVSLRANPALGTKTYAPDTIRGFRASIHRFVKETRAIDVIGNEVFRLSNETYSCVLRLSCQLRERTSGEQPGFSAITDSDMALLKQYFTRRDPVRLQDEVFFNIVYHFGFRGREWIRDMKLSSLQFSVVNNVRCIDMIQTGREKTITAEDRGKCTTSKQIRMFSIQGQNCPVEAVDLYVSKLPPGTDVLFPKPIKVRPDSAVWYSHKQVLGKNTLFDMMKGISKRAGLQFEYTNHCIRATVVTNLTEAGHSLQEIKYVTGTSVRA